MAYFGWAAYASISLLPPAAPWSDFTERLIDTITLITLLSFWIAFWLQKSPWTLFIYVSFPCFFWREFFSRGLPAITSSLSLNRRSCVQGLLTVFALQSMVVSLCFLCFLLVSNRIVGCIYAPFHVEPGLCRHWHSVALLYLALFPTFWTSETCLVLESELLDHRNIPSPSS